MSTAIVLTVIGEDHPGIVERLSAILAEHGGNWVESSMSSLAGQFAGILLATLPEQQVAGCLEGFATLEAEGLTVISRRARTPGSNEGARAFVLDLVGHDRAGIVRDITRVLKAHNVNVHELETGVESASMAGGELFRARACLVAPPGTDLARLQAGLETIAAELMVDISLRD